MKRLYVLIPSACSPDCVLCDGAGRCTACAHHMFLMEGYCTPDCGSGYSPDPRTRVCRGELHVFILIILFSLTVSNKRSHLQFSVSDKHLCT